MEKMSVARALIKLKTLDSQIEKEIAVFVPTFVKSGKILPPGINSEEEFNKETKAKYQSINDLIKQKRKLKSAIINSNAKTKVTINKEKMTIAEAIERKASIEYDKKLLARCRDVFHAATNNINTHNEKVKERLDKLLEVTFSKESSKVKADEYDAVAKPFLENNEAKLIDPLNILKVNEKTDNDILTFEQEVNIVLTESNAKTEINV